MNHRWRGKAPRIGHPEAKDNGREALRDRCPIISESTLCRTEKQPNARSSAKGSGQARKPGPVKIVKGGFRAPRTLPLLLGLLKSKKLSERQDPSSVYLGLWARHFDSGVVEITNEMDMAYEAGYTGGRALRTWQERMALLKKLGFIRCQKIANQKYRYVLMVEPSEVIETLAKKGLVDQSWRATYDGRRIVTKEAEPAKTAKKKLVKVVPMPGAVVKTK